MVKKYANVLMCRSDLTQFQEALRACDLCAQDVNFKAAIASKFISKDQKVSFVLDVLNSLGVNTTNSFCNLLKLLAENDSLGVLGNIYSEISKQQELARGVYQGVIYTKKALDDVSINNVASKLSNRFGKQISLVNRLKNTDEVRVSLDDLGYEIVLSNDAIKCKIKDFIIKAI